jgi:hypothetical protein
MANDLSSIFSGEIAKPVRSTFLTVLCVLTFAGSLLGIFSGVNSYITADEAVATIKKAQADTTNNNAEQKNDRDAEFGKKMMSSMAYLNNPDQLRQSGIAAVICNLFTLAGAILMWRLNRIGFYIYIAGTIIGVAGTFIIFGADNFILNMGSAVAGFIGLVFILMYAFNLKDMKPVRKEVS